MRQTVAPGSVFGRWTVLDQTQTDEKGQRRWLCRCECGTERFVLERSLAYAASTSCGCLTRENAGRIARQDLTGQTFGMLTVLHKAEQRTGSVLWTCRCQCGNVCDVPGAQLKAGKRISCGCLEQRGRPMVDISGRVIHQLTALYPLETRDNAGYVMWHCRCECGNETDVSYNALMYGNIKSCGCRKREHTQMLNKQLTHVAGTALEMLKSTKLPVNNTTGVKGVYFIKGKYVAKIVFQKKQYFLGTFDRLEDAKAARQQAEVQIRNTVVDFYQRWKKRADDDPLWAEENPVQIAVERGADKEIILRCLPVME